MNQDYIKPDNWSIIEEEFDVEIPDEDAQKIKTVKDVIEYIESK